MPKRETVCASLDESYRKKFAEFLPLWIERHRTEILAGEQLMREDAARNNIPFQKSIDDVTTIDAQLLQRASEALRKENCDNYLMRLRSD